MKQIIATTFCTLMICGLLLTVGTVMAAEPGYEHTSYLTQVTPTIDGQWTTDDEWTDGEPIWIGTDVFFTSTRDNDMSRWIVEFVTDTTNDAGDMWRFCIDPVPSDSTEIYYKWEIVGHTEFTWFIGVGGQWTDLGPGGATDWAESFSASPNSDTPHWILEFQRPTDETGFPMDDSWNFLIQAHDASNTAFHAWPPTDPEIPETWGVENYSTEAIPEGLTFAVMALLTTVSMLVSYKYFVKRKETKTQ